MKARIPGMPGGGNMMKQLQKMQEELAAKQEVVENSEFSATVGGGTVEAVVNGKNEVLSLSIQPDVVDPEDIEMLQDLVIAAVNEAMRKASDAMEQVMQQAKDSVGIPGL